MWPAPAARPVCAACVTAAFSLLATRAAVAQATGNVDVAVSTVRYDGFLPSGAASLTPAVSWERPGATITARGTYLRFESGRRSLHGILAASVLTPRPLLPAPWRGELTVSSGGSSYASFASFWHATGEIRLHYLAEGRGVWVGGTGGRTSYGRSPRPVAVAALGAWSRRATLTVGASASRSFVGDTAYTDLTSRMHIVRGTVAVDASVGDRMSSRGGGHGVFGDGSVTLTLGERTAIFLSGGRYPTDAISGTVSGRYLSAGIRLRTVTPRPVLRAVPTPTQRSPANGDGDDPADRGGPYGQILRSPRERTLAEPAPLLRALPLLRLPSLLLLVLVRVAIPVILLRASSHNTRLRPSSSPEISPIGSPSSCAATPQAPGRPCGRFPAACIGSTSGSTGPDGSPRQEPRGRLTTSAARSGSSPCLSLAQRPARRPRAVAAAPASPIRRPRVRAPVRSCSTAIRSGLRPQATDRS